MPPAAPLHATSSYCVRLSCLYFQRRARQWQPGDAVADAVATKCSCIVALSPALSSTCTSLPCSHLHSHRLVHGLVKGQALLDQPVHALLQVELVLLDALGSQLLCALVGLLVDLFLDALGKLLGALLGLSRLAPLLRLRLRLLALQPLLDKTRDGDGASWCAQESSSDIYAFPTSPPSATVRLWSRQLRPPRSTRKGRHRIEVRRSCLGS